MALSPSKSTAISDIILAATCVWALVALQGASSTGLAGTQKFDSNANNVGKLWFGMVSLRLTLYWFQRSK